MTSEPGDWTTPSQAEGERDDEPEWKRHEQMTERSTPSQAEGERDETAAERETGGSRGSDRLRPAG